MRCLNGVYGRIDEFSEVPNCLKMSPIFNRYMCVCVLSETISNLDQFNRYLGSMHCSFIVKRLLSLLPTRLLAFA